MKTNQIFSILIILAALQFLFLLHISEFLYPNYSVSNNYISDLGATCREGVCRFYQPSSIIFNISVSLLGILLMIASYYSNKLSLGKIFTILIFITGLGSLGVGLFPENYGTLHKLSALTTFIPASLLGLFGSRVIKHISLKIISIIMSLISITSLIFFAVEKDLGLGVGGIERLIVYPILFWALIFGGYIYGYYEYTG